MKTFKIWQLVLFFFLLKTNFAWSQKLIADSLILDFKSALPETLLLAAKIDTVLDQRDISDPRLIQIEETTHYGFVPVDLFIRAKQPLNVVIQKALSNHITTQNNPLSLGIKHFEFSKQSHFFFFKKYKLHALITLYQLTQTDSLLPIGKLVYASETTDFLLNTKLNKGYENTFSVWCQELVENINEVIANPESSQNLLPYNFCSGQPDFPWRQLNATAELVILQNGFLVDGYLTFTFPEAKRFFNQSMNTLRYRQQNKFSSIEYGLLDNYWNYRLNSNFRLRFRSHLFLGINRWKDMKTTRHKVYDALIGDLSFGQSLQFHPIHKKTLFAGIGVFQNLYYIYSKNFQFQAGLTFNAGLQL